MKAAESRADRQRLAVLLVFILASCRRRPHAEISTPNDDASAPRDVAVDTLADAPDPCESPSGPLHDVIRVTVASSKFHQGTNTPWDSALEGPLEVTLENLTDRVVCLQHYYGLSLRFRELGSKRFTDKFHPEECYGEIEVLDAKAHVGTMIGERIRLASRARHTLEFERIWIPFSGPRVPSGVFEFAFAVMPVEKPLTGKVGPECGELLRAAWPQATLSPFVPLTVAK